MARVYTAYVTDPESGQPIYCARCQAINRTTDAVVETQYTDWDGEADFVAIPNVGDFDIRCTWGVGHFQIHKNVFSMSGSIADADKVDGIHAADIDAHTVDAIHAATVATANKLLALNAASKLPASITGDADTVDTKHYTDITTAMDTKDTAAMATHTAAADPHAGYRLESADHTHVSAGLQGGTLDHGAALTGLADNDHPQYLLLTDIDDSPVDGETAAPISSNWAFDHAASTGNVHGAWFEVVGTANVQILENKVYQLGTGDYIYIPTVLTSDHSFAGITTWELVGEAVAFGQVVYYHSTKKFWLAQADAAATTEGRLGIAVSVAAANAYALILKEGSVRDDTWNWITAGTPLYLSDNTAGAMLEAAPSDGGDRVRLVGWVMDADNIYFDPEHKSTPA